MTTGTANSGECARPTWSAVLKSTDFEAALFAAKCLGAVLLAYYVAARIGLSRPYWSVTTCFIVAQTLSGAALTKAVYRIVGTVTGAAVAVLLVLNFVNEPWVLSLAMAAWLGLCVYLGVLDRTPRSYLFVLAGFTASIVGFQCVNTPDNVFTFAMERVQEISIGIVCGSLVHGVVFPRTVTGRLTARIDAMLAAAERRSVLALAGAGSNVLRIDEAQISSDLAELDQLAINLPFDTARLVPSRRAVRKLQAQLALLLPLASAVDERLERLSRLDGGVPPAIAELASCVGTWLRGEGSAGNRSADGAPLIERTMALQFLADGQPIWREMLILSLLARLSALIAAHQECLSLRDRIKHPTWRDGAAEILLGGGGRELHVDRGFALRAAAGTATTVLLCCWFWIQSAWVDGAQATFIAAVCCSLAGNVDRPRPAMFRFLAGFIAGLAASTFYGFVVFPRTADYGTLAGVLAPTALLLGSLLARPALMRVAQGAVVAFPNTVGLYLAYNPDFHSFINVALAQLTGAAFATVMLGFYQTIDAASGIARLQRASYQDIAARAQGHFDDSQGWLDRMLDRVNLLLPRLPAKNAGDELLQTLKDLRIGYVAGELGAFSASATSAERTLIVRMLDGIGGHFRVLNPACPQPPPAALLADVDRTIEAFGADRQLDRRRRGLMLLTSLRCHLFPHAPDFRMEPPRER